MKRWIRNVRANLYYMRRPFLEFLPLLIILSALLAWGSFAFHHLYEQEQLSYRRALYITYCLVFMEHVIEFPDHWLLQAFYFLLPPLGLVVILDGLVRFGYHVLRRDDNLPEWVRAMAKAHHDHVVLCGLGRVGLRTLQQLIKLGEDVVVLEKNDHNPNIRYAERHHVPVLIGSGREESILEDLNISQAKSIILATDDDLANLEMAMDARKIKPSIRVVLRMFDQELASKIRDSFNIHLAFSTASQSAPLFATSSSDRTIINAFYVGERLLVVANLDITAESELIGKTIGELTNNEPLYILDHSRRTGKETSPRNETTLEAGDRITIQCEPHTLKEMHELNHDSQSKV